MIDRWAPTPECGSQPSCERADLSEWSGRRLQPNVAAAVQSHRRGAEMPDHEYRSSQSWRGIPFVHVAIGRWEAGRYRPGRARGLIAVGDTAVGLVAVGVIAVGGIALGPVALGLVALGVVAAGLVSAGVVAIGLVALGVVAVGVRAVGVIVGQLGAG